MTARSATLDTAARLQLIVTAAEDLGATLEPLRAARVRRQARVAAGVGGATSAVVTTALIAANIGWWTSVGVALGVGALPLLLALGGKAARRAHARHHRRGADEEADRARTKLSYACLSRMANADGHVSEEERVLLEVTLLQRPLSEQQRNAVVDGSDEPALEHGRGLDAQLRREVLRGCWMLAEADGVAEQEERCFAQLADELGLVAEIDTIKRDSRDLQAQLDELVTAMFRTCQQVLEPQLKTASATAFLESLAGIAATPRARRALRNSLGAGFSPGGVVQTLSTHPQRTKLVAQAQNAVRAVYSEPQAARAATDRLLELAAQTALGRSAARTVCRDVDALFDQLLAEQTEQIDRASGGEASPERVS